MDIFIRHIYVQTHYLTTAQEVGIATPSLQVSKMRLREVKDLPELNI